MWRTWRWRAGLAGRVNWPFVPPWAQIADATGGSADQARREYREFAEGQHNLWTGAYGGERGHPLLVARAAWAEIPDAGLRDLPARLVPCDDLGDPGDVDTPADLPERLRVP